MADIFEAGAGKIFIGGISPMTSIDTLRKYFGQFGELTDCVIMQDRGTGKFRGFGFVTYKDHSVISDVLSQIHVLDGKTVDCKRALPKDQIPETKKENAYRTKKIFVGGLPQSARDQELKNYFEQFGRIEKSTVMMDKQTGKSRGFGFVIFANEDSVERVIERLQDHNIDGKWVEVKKAVPRSKTNTGKDTPLLSTDVPASPMGLLTPQTISALMGHDSPSSNEESSEYDQMYNNHHMMGMRKPVITKEISEWDNFVNSSNPTTPTLPSPMHAQNSILGFEIGQMIQERQNALQNNNINVFGIPQSPHLHQQAMMYRTPQPSPFSSPAVGFRAWTPRVETRKICKAPIIGLSDTFAINDGDSDDVRAMFHSSIKDKAENVSKHRETLFSLF